MRPQHLDSFEAMKVHAERRVAVSGSLLVTADLNGQSVTIPAIALAEWPDKFRLELQDPVGGLIALLVINGEQFWLYQSEKPEILMGSVKKIRFPLIPEGQASEVVRLVLARPYIERMERGDFEKNTSIFRDGKLRETVSWDDSSGEPQSWKREFGGKLISETTYEDFEFREGLRFPTKTRLSGLGTDGKERHALFAWKDWEPSVPKEKKLFQIPQPQSFGRKIKALP